MFRSIWYLVKGITLLLITSHVFAQDNLRIITASFNAYNEKNLQEKIFVHTDKNLYLAGEIIWFKLYNTDAGFHKPLDISKVAYVEILDTLNKPVLQAKIGLNKGLGDGSFYLPQTIASGNYKLRAYTRWMKNFDAALFFEKNLTLINLQKMPGISSKDSTEQYDIRFFPEGGDLVYGLPAKVAFKAFTQKGKGADFTGYLLDGSDTLLHFTPLHTGMGNFIFTPMANHHYKAVVKPAQGAAFTKELPFIFEKGYTMQVSPAGENLSVTVASNIPGASAVYVFIHNGISVSNASGATLENGKAVLTIKSSSLQEGVSHITVFDAQRKPVCERLYYKRPTHKLDMAIHTDEQLYATRKKISIEINREDHAFAGDSASVSMAVYRLDSLQTAEDNTIETYLLLGAELKGSIENPSWYFNAPEMATGIALDNLMLTNGWRRFKWTEVLQNQQAAFRFAPEVNGHILTGRIVHTRTGQPQKFTEGFLSVPSNTTQFKAATSDEEGNVIYELKNFYGGTSLVAQPNTLLDTTSKIEIDDPFSKEYSAAALPAFTRPSGYPNTLLNLSISMQVQNIYAEDKLKQYAYPAFADTSSFYVNADLRYNLDDYTRFTSMEEVLREYVAFVNVSRRGGRVYLPTINIPQHEFFMTDPLVMIDGVPVFNFNKLLEFDPLKLKSLDVLTRRYLLGNSVFEGVLNWKSYSPTLSNYEFKPNAVVLDYEGLQLEREFYAPVYDNEAATSSHFPDFRNVLQWSPNITLHNNQKSTVSFYSSDITGKYVVVIQGLTTGGLCGSKTVTFEVK